MDKGGDSNLILGQKTGCRLGQMGIKEVCELPAQILGQRAVENVVGLIFNGL